MALLCASQQSMAMPSHYQLACSDWETPAHIMLVLPSMGAALPHSLACWRESPSSAPKLAVWTPLDCMGPLKNDYR